MGLVFFCGVREPLLLLDPGPLVTILSGRLPTLAGVRRAGRPVHHAPAGHGHPLEQAGMGSLVRHGWFASLARARARLAWCGMLGE